MERIDLKQFWHSAQRPLLAFPSGSDQILAQRYAALQDHQIDALYRFGDHTLNGFSVLGLGRCGLVMLAERAGGRLALKIRRTDAKATSLSNEAKLLAIANTSQIGPILLSASPDVLCMEYIQGPQLCQWLRTRQQHNLHVIHPILKDLLEQAFRLDQIRINHGNLRSIRDHVILSSRGPILLDFSSARITHTPVNVAHLTQGLFFRGAIAKVLQQFMPFPSKAQLIEALRHYKQHPNLDKFNQILDLLGIHIG